MSACRRDFDKTKCMSSLITKSEPEARKLYSPKCTKFRQRFLLFFELGMRNFFLGKIEVF